MRERSSVIARVRRRVNRALVNRQTDSHDLRTYEQEGRLALLFVIAVFSSTRRGAEGELPRGGKRSPSGGFSFGKTKENGGRIPLPARRETAAPTKAPAGSPGSGWISFTPRCGPTATGGPSTASAGGHWPPWPGRRHRPPPGSKAPWPGSAPCTAPPGPSGRSPPA